MQAKHEALGSTQGGGGCTLCLSCEASRNHTLKVYRVFCSSCPLNKHIYILGFNVNLFRFFTYLLALVNVDFITMNTT